MEIISRAEAKASGQIKYFTGKPCPKGHISERSTGGGACISCKAEWSTKNSSYWKDRYWKNPEEDRQKSLEYRRRTNWDAVRYHRDKESEKARNAEYLKANPHISREKNKRRHARKLEAVPSWYSEFDAFVIREMALLCVARSISTGIKWHIDHMVPLQAKTACGLHFAYNLQVIPAYMNAWKKNRMVLTMPDEWLAML